MKTNTIFLRRGLVALTLVLLTASGARAADFPTGFFVGLDAGFGGSTVQYRDRDRTIFEDPLGGGMGGMRFGYALSPRFALSFEGRGFGRGEDEEDEWGLGAGVIALTWRPQGGGFYLRAGLGAGGGDFRAQDMPETVTVKERFAHTFAVGYDWRLGRHTSLGLAAEAMGLDVGGVTGYDGDTAGAAGLTAQFTWHL